MRHHILRMQLKEIANRGTTGRTGVVLSVKDPLLGRKKSKKPVEALARYSGGKRVWRSCNDLTLAMQWELTAPEGYHARCHLHCLLPHDESTLLSVSIASACKQAKS